MSGNIDAPLYLKNRKKARERINLDHGFCGRRYQEDTRNKQLIWYCDTVDMEFNREYFTTKNLHQITEIRHTAVITGEIIQFIYKDFLLTKIGLYYWYKTCDKQTENFRKYQMLQMCAKTLTQMTRKKTRKFSVNFFSSHFVARVA